MRQHNAVFCIPAHGQLHSLLQPFCFRCDIWLKIMKPVCGGGGNTTGIVAEIQREETHIAPPEHVIPFPARIRRGEIFKVPVGVFSVDLMVTTGHYQRHIATGDLPEGNDKGIHHLLIKKCRPLQISDKCKEIRLELVLCEDLPHIFRTEMRQLQVCGGGKSKIFSGRRSGTDRLHFAISLRPGADIIQQNRPELIHRIRLQIIQPHAVNCPVMTDLPAEIVIDPLPLICAGQTVIHGSRRLAIPCKDNGKRIFFCVRECHKGFVLERQFCGAFHDLQCGIHAATDPAAPEGAEDLKDHLVASFLICQLNRVVGIMDGELAIGTTACIQHHFSVEPERPLPVCSQPESKVTGLIGIKICGQDRPVQRRTFFRIRDHVEYIHKTFRIKIERLTGYQRSIAEVKSIINKTGHMFQYIRHPGGKKVPPVPVDNILTKTH